MSLGRRRHGPRPPARLQARSPQPRLQRAAGPRDHPRRLRADRRAGDRQRRRRRQCGWWHHCRQAGRSRRRPRSALDGGPACPDEAPLSAGIRPNSRSPGRQASKGARPRPGRGARRLARSILEGWGACDVWRRSPEVRRAASPGGSAAADHGRGPSGVWRGVSSGFARLAASAGVDASRVGALRALAGARPVLADRSRRLDGPR
jgi:hypothetical protein